MMAKSKAKRTKGSSGGGGGSGGGNSSGGSGGNGSGSGSAKKQADLAAELSTVVSTINQFHQELVKSPRILEQVCHISKVDLLQEIHKGEIAEVFELALLGLDGMEVEGGRESWVRGTIPERTKEIKERYQEKTMKAAEEALCQAVYMRAQNATHLPGAGAYERRLMELAASRHPAVIAEQAAAAAAAAADGTGGGNGSAPGSGKEGLARILGRVRDPAPGGGAEGGREGGVRDGSGGGGNGSNELDLTANVMFLSKNGNNKFISGSSSRDQGHLQINFAILKDDIFTILVNDVMASLVQTNLIHTDNSGMGGDGSGSGDDNASGDGDADADADADAKTITVAGKGSGSAARAGVGTRVEVEKLWDPRNGTMLDLIDAPFVEQLRHPDLAQFLADGAAEFMADESYDQRTDYLMDLFNVRYHADIPFVPTTFPYPKFSDGQILLQFVDTLTYPKPMRAFKMLFKPDTRIGFLRTIMLDECQEGLQDGSTLVMKIRGKELKVENDALTLDEVGVPLKFEQKIVLTKKLADKKAAAVEGEGKAEAAVKSGKKSGQDVSDSNRRFVGDLLLGAAQSQRRPDGSSTSVELSRSEAQRTTSLNKVRLRQGYEILGKTLEKIILQRICDAYHKEQEAKRSELELIALLEEEDFLGGAGGKGSSGTKASKASKAAAIAVSKSTPPLLSAGTVTRDSLGKQNGQKVEPKQEQEQERPHQTNEPSAELDSDDDDDDGDLSKLVPTTLRVGSTSQLQYASPALSVSVSSSVDAGTTGLSAEEIDMQVAKKKKDKKADKQKEILKRFDEEQEAQRLLIIAKRKEEEAHAAFKLREERRRAIMEEQERINREYELQQEALAAEQLCNEAAEDGVAKSGKKLKPGRNARRKKQKEAQADADEQAESVGDAVLDPYGSVSHTNKVLISTAYQLGGASGGMMGSQATEQYSSATPPGLAGPPLPSLTQGLTGGGYNSNTMGGLGYQGGTAKFSTDYPLSMEHGLDLNLRSAVAGGSSISSGSSGGSDTAYTSAPPPGLAGLGAAASTAAPVPVAIPSSGNKFCTNCGNPLAPGGRFCGNCGTAAMAAVPAPVTAAPSPPPAAAAAAAPIAPAATTGSAFTGLGLGGFGGLLSPSDVMSGFGSDSLFADSSSTLGSGSNVLGDGDTRFSYGAGDGGLGSGLGISMSGGLTTDRAGASSAHQVASQKISGFLGLEDSGAGAGLTWSEGSVGGSSSNFSHGLGSSSDIGAGNNTGNNANNTFGIGSVVDDILLAKQRGPPKARR